MLHEFCVDIPHQRTQLSKDFVSKQIVKDAKVHQKKKIRNHLQAVMPSYKEKAYEGLKYIENLI